MSEPTTRDIAMAARFIGANERNSDADATEALAWLIAGVRLSERERCVKVCEAVANHPYNLSDTPRSYGAMECVDAIRALPAGVDDQASDDSSKDPT